MKKKNIIGIAIVVIAIIAVIVGITVNNHQKVVKEAESMSASVEASKTDLITSYTKQFDDITSKEYKTEKEYIYAKELLTYLKSEIEKSDVKDAEKMIDLITNIDKTIKIYDNKILSLFTTETTTEKPTEKSTNVTKATSNNSPHSNTTSKSPTSNSGSKNTATKATTKHTTTTTKPTTQKKYKPNPSYGYTTTSTPNYDDYATDGWNQGRIIYTWDASTSMWNFECHYINGVSDEYNWRVYAYQAFPEPNRDGKYNGEEVSKMIWVWLG